MNEHIQNLDEAQAKIILGFAIREWRNAIYTPDIYGDTARLGFLTQKIETLAKKNTNQHENNH
jgi:hypothetical protein